MTRLTDLYALCTELYQCLEHLDRAYDIPIPPNLIERTRCALATPPIDPIPLGGGRMPGSDPDDWAPNIKWCWVFGDDWFILGEGNMNWEYWDHHGYTHWLPWWAIPLPKETK